MPPRARDRLLDEALSEFDKALSDYREALRKAQLAVRKARSRLDQGKAATEVLKTSGLAAYRNLVDEAAKALERSRHRMRLLVIEIARQEGTSLGELAEHWGLSRQRVQTLAKESEDDDGA